MRYREQVDDDDDDAVLDMSIVGDEEEQHRIELEHNLQDLSIQLSLSNPSQASDQECSINRCSRQDQQSESSFEIEYPRHNPRPRDVSIFHGQNSSFLDNTQLEQDVNTDYYPYRSVDDDADVHYIGNTMSTAAHHASAVTLSAGLGGRDGKRVYVGEASLSGAEYDPDRPLDSVLNGVADDLSMLNMDNSRMSGKRKVRNASLAHTQVTFNPLIVDHDTSATGCTNRSFTNARNSKQAQGHATTFYSDREPTPKAKTRMKRPSLNVQPPTPSTGANATGGSNATNGSKFTRLAKTLAREIEASQRWASAPELEDRSLVKPARKKQSMHRSPFQDVINHSFSISASPFPPKAKARPGRSAAKTADGRLNDMSRHERSQSKLVNLPDVTGLTSVIGSPTRKDHEWRTYTGGDEGERVEVELLKTLTTLQTRLNQLESQNLVSRRRVRELEVELETCKLEVKRERTRVLEREEIIVAQQRDFQKQRSAPSKPARTVPDPASEYRYNEVVEEKKALEALIATLRSHLSRLTNELSNQQSQLDDLRSLRECDLRDLRDKIAEVDTLKLEVERLGGEVEILRGVVEEGLNERRRAKESMDSANISLGSISKAPLNLEEESISCPGQNEVVQDPSRVECLSPPPSRPQSRQERRPHFSSKARSSKFATAGPSRLDAPAEGRFIDVDELERVSAEVEERRSERSESNHSQDLDTSRLQTVHENGRQDVQRTRSSRIRVAKDDDRPRARIADEDSPRSSRPAKNQIAEVETPFPQIRGEQLERLFFSAPEHNEKTCRVCHRHRRPGASDDELDFPSWLPPRKRTKTGKEDGRSRYRETKVRDVEGSDQEIPAKYGPRVTNKAPFSEDRLPPQTVLVRVLRELEDDFTHYKGIYIELADQYKIMDAASNVPKRNVLAEHLKEVIDTLEQKGDQIASLYDLLTFKDKPVAESVVPERRRAPRTLRSPRSPRQIGARRHGGLRKYSTYS